MQEKTSDANVSLLRRRVLYPLSYGRVLSVHISLTWTYQSQPASRDAAVVQEHPPLDHALRRESLAEHESHVHMKTISIRDLHLGSLNK